MEYFLVGWSNNDMKILEYIVDKYDLNIGRQPIVEIPNMGRAQLAELFAELKFKKGVEIGVEKGIYSEILLKVNPKLQLFSIDPWKASSYEPGIQAVDYRQKHYDDYYRETKKRLSGYKSKIIRKKSLTAVKDFKDNSLDFVYIDGNHDFINVTNDIYYWSQKIRIGGIISGDDFAYFPAGKQNHVKHVLLAYTKAYGIRPVFVVGAEAKGQPGVIRDNFRSWFWIKG
ncbi:hypothetical protein A2714_02820 [Candidatus Woesebacteria bacterium RIFCSPHIGHO2_01_FULL_38_9]|uniref:Class I SAM-dependent methyltransferase n=1 Tax=Candidatus Woesebacteria bacterium RIFCSPHIGHO2_01_FULL_38_9 TaxID=1802492 RepID=A0A1F7XY64_9BACT|nr:MAG: hypothetical protein A2714_02820 [Candidatus Woesebacteria bacterium RIFCSPHIGHO2_01_FULL_38_9]